MCEFEKVEQPEIEEASKIFEVNLFEEEEKVYILESNSSKVIRTTTKIL